MDIQDGVGRRMEPGTGAWALPASQMLVADLVEEFNSAPDSETLVARVLHRAVLETRSDRAVISWIDGDEMIVAGCLDPFGEPVVTGSRWPLAGEQVSVLALSAGRCGGGDARWDGPGPCRRQPGAARHLCRPQATAGGAGVGGRRAHGHPLCEPAAGRGVRRRGPRRARRHRPLRRPAAPRCSARRPARRRAGRAG